MTKGVAKPPTMSPRWFRELGKPSPDQSERIVVEFSQGLGNLNKNITYNTILLFIYIHINDLPYFDTIRHLVILKYQNQY